MFGLTSNFGKLLDEMSTRIRWPGLPATGESAPANRPLSEIEQNVVDAVVKILLNGLADTWKAVTNLTFAIRARETRPQMLQVAAPNEIVVAVVFPLYFLTGLEGRMFAPLATAYLTALLCSLAVSLTVTPALASYLLPRARFLRHEGDAYLLRWLKRIDRPIELTCLDFGDVLVAHLPGEPFVEYQLKAQALRPDAFVCVAGYGDDGPGYIPTNQAFFEGGYEPTVALAAPSEELMVEKLAKLLKAK